MDKSCKSRPECQDNVAQDCDGYCLKHFQAKKDHKRQRAKEYRLQKKKELQSAVHEAALLRKKEELQSIINQAVTMLETKTTASERLVVQISELENQKLKDEIQKLQHEKQTLKDDYKRLEDNYKKLEHELQKRNQTEVFPKLEAEEPAKEKKQTTDSRPGSIYIIQEREFIGQNVYKIGRTVNIVNRMMSYPKGSIVRFHTTCKQLVYIEGEVKKQFAENFIWRKDLGAEYFQGDVNHMRQHIISIIEEFDT